MRKLAVAVLALALALVFGKSSTAVAGSCSCKSGECQSGFSACWFDDAGTCITVSGRCTTPITLLPGTDVKTRLVDEQKVPAAYAYAGCAKILSERTLTASTAARMRSQTQQITL